MKNFRLTIILLIISAFSFSSCNEEEQIPSVSVNFQIFLDDPDYLDLNAIGNYVYVLGGYKGIVIYRKSIDEFAAYDRACPHDPYEDEARIVVSEDGLYATDPFCGSEFSLMYNGAILKGPSKESLREYYVTYNLTNNSIWVSN